MCGGKEKKDIYTKDNQSYRVHMYILQKSTFICGLVKLKVQYVRLGYLLN